jgi:hypothetical protein
MQFGAEANKPVAQFVFRISSGTYNAPAILQASDYSYGDIRWVTSPSNMNNFTEVAKITAKTDGIPGGSTNLPSYLSFLTVSSGTATSSEKLRIGSDGQLAVNGAATIVGSMTVAGTNNFALGGCQTMRLLNNSGITLTTGTVVKAHENVELAITTSAPSGNGRVAPIGVVQNTAGCANGAYCEVGYAGICWVQLKAGEVCDTSDDYLMGGDVAGYAECEDISTGTNHNAEIGHPSKPSTADSTLIKGYIHFN